MGKVSAWLAVTTMGLPLPTSVILLTLMEAPASFSSIPSQLPLKVIFPRFFTLPLAAGVR